MTNEEIERQSKAAFQLLRSSIDPAAVEALGEEWFAECEEAFSGYTRHIVAEAYEEAARFVRDKKASKEELREKYPAGSEAHLVLHNQVDVCDQILDDLRALKDSLVAEPVS